MSKLSIRRITVTGRGRGPQGVNILVVITVREWFCDSTGGIRLTDAAEGLVRGKMFESSTLLVRQHEGEVVEAIRYYDRIADLSDRDLQTEGGLHGYLRRLEKILAGIQGSAVLEVGAGAGRFSIALKERGFSVLATDLSHGMLRRLSQRCSDIPTVVADAHHLPFRDGIFDSVFSSDVLEHLPNPSQAIKEQTRVCRSKGTIQAIVPNGLCPYYWRNLLRERYWWRYGTSPIHSRRSLKEMASIFKSHGLRLYQLDTFLLVPTRVRGRGFATFRAIEKFAERILPVRLFLGVNYILAGPS